MPRGRNLIVDSIIILLRSPLRTLILLPTSAITQRFRALLWRVRSTGNLRGVIEPLQIQEAGHDSQDRLPPGAIVPVQSLISICCGSLFGGEIAL